jgi:hypothetical protein
MKSTEGSCSLSIAWSAWQAVTCSLTDDVFDVGRDFSKFSEKRKAAKSYFKEGFFRLSKEPLHGQL